jgi:hypothetical protein
MRRSATWSMASNPTRSTLIATEVLLRNTLGSSSVSAQEPFWRVGATLSRWSLASETATTLPAAAWALSVNATRWRGSRGIGGGVLVSPSISGSVPPLLGLQIQAALSSSSHAHPIWRPAGDALVGFGVLNFADYVAYLVSVCDYSRQCRGAPDFRPGWIPFFSVSGGFDTRLRCPLGSGGRRLLTFPSGTGIHQVGGGSRISASD